MIVKSIRWRVQLWHAFLLLLVVSSFGSVLYYRTRQARLEEIDAELQAAARVLEGSLRGVPAHVLWDAADFPREEHPPPPEAGRPGPPPPGAIPPWEHHLDRALSLPEHYRHRAGDVDQAPYFVVRNAEDKVLKASPGAEDVPPLETGALPPETSHLVRQRGPLREVAVMGPHRSTVIVGRSVHKELGDLTRFGWQIGLTGLGVMALGLAGGWLLARRILRPIDAMSATAADISASNLSRRIEITETESELGRLAQVLNNTFDRLEAAFDQQVRFTADASHELRTPLAVILSHAELALARQRSEEEYQETIRTCQRAAQRMRLLVESLLTLARIDSGEMSIEKRPLDLGRIAKDCADMVQPLAEEKGLHLCVDLPSCTIIGDEGRLAQTITNLLTNAISYNRKGGNISLSTAEQEGEVQMRIEDTGIGIPAEDLPHVFERFYRVDKARSRAAGGCGLGLAICKSIVEAHGGTIAVSSAVDRGTTFTVRLPQSQPAGSTPSPPGSGWVRKRSSELRMKDEKRVE